VHSIDDQTGFLERHAPTLYFCFLTAAAGIESGSSNRSRSRSSRLRVEVIWSTVSRQIGNVRAVRPRSVVLHLRRGFNERDRQDCSWVALRFIRRIVWMGQNIGIFTQLEAGGLFRVGLLPTSGFENAILTSTLSGWESQSVVSFEAPHT
jgi:hypothetical protein